MLSCGKFQYYVQIFYKDKLMHTMPIIAKTERSAKIIATKAIKKDHGSWSIKHSTLAVLTGAACSYRDYDRSKVWR